MWRRGSLQSQPPSGAPWGWWGLGMDCIEGRPVLTDGLPVAVRIDYCAEPMDGLPKRESSIGTLIFTSVSL